MNLTIALFSFQTNNVFTVQSEQPRSTGDALTLCRSVAALAGGMARRAVIILGLIRVRWTGSVALVLMHYQMMLATGAFVWSVLTAGAIGFARHARAVFRICAEKMR